MRGDDVLTVQRYQRSGAIILLIGAWLWASVQEGKDDSINGWSNETIAMQINLCLVEEELPWPLLTGEVDRLYQQRNHHPIWYSNGVLREEAARLLQRFDQAHTIGLTKQAFPIDRIRNGIVKNQLPDSSDGKLQAKTDVWLSAAALVYLSQLKYGMVRTRQIWTVLEDSIPRDKLIGGLLNLCCGFDHTMSTYEPESIHCKWFTQNLSQWWTIWEQFEEKCEASSNNWFLAHSDAEFDTLVTQLLRWTGFYLNGESDITVYTDELIPSYFASRHVEAGSLIHFKRLLYDDFLAKMEMVQLNMDRLKVEAPDGRDYIWINIPASELIIYENEFPIRRHYVVVGSPHTPTPVISGPMAEVITFPRWNIPKSIVVKEISPAMRRNSGYLKKKGYELVDWYGNPMEPDDVDWEAVNEEYVPFRVIQEPGYMNALGVIKFNFINTQSIYLHDTNAKGYFKRKNRALSHGCIRVEDPLELAKYLLSESSYKSLREHLAEKTTKHYRVSKELPVYLRYLTCSVNAPDEIIFHEDFYGKDIADLNLLWSSLPKW